MAVRRRKGSPYWQFDFTVKGRRFRGSCKTACKDTAEIIEGKEKHDALLEAWTGRKPRMTLDIACGRYLLDHAGRLPSAPTIRYQTRNILAALGKGTYLDDLGDGGVASMIAALRGRMADSSANRHLTLLRAVLRMARDRWRVAVTMPNFKAHYLREPEPRDRYLSRDDAAKLIAAAAAHLKAPIRFSLLTGVRLANCMGLDWSQVDMAGRTITFRVKSPNPGGKPHTIPMSEPLLVLLANLGPMEHGSVFTYKGRPIANWNRAWRTAKRNAGIRDFRWHDLRHTAASWMVNEGVPLDVVQDILGHEDISTTRRYAHRDVSHMRDAMKKLAGDEREDAKEEGGQ